MISYIVLMSLLAACDKADVILIDGSSVAKEISSDCGLISIKVTTFNGQYFFIKQSYDLTQEINVYPDSLVFKFKGDHITFSIVGSEKINNENQIILSGEGYLKLISNLMKKFTREIQFK